ncbi:hypothetical protein [Streptomyces sp. NRRL S-350]|uniref:hypothetical protein n=1 Tax=Streptomyces sp. NRRL S-350 TaxID=1463902 RepID=UPI0004C0AC97|nr:hypothetical protein [Streptomyces sp. NRRL S-350]
MPRRGERLRRPPAGTTGCQERVTAIGVRIRTEFGKGERERQVRIDPAAFACPLLAAQLADAWLDYAKTYALVASYDHRTAVASFCDFAGPYLASLGQDPAAVALESTDVDLAEAVYAWERQLPGRYPPSSNRPYHLACALLNVVNLAASRNPRVSDRLRERVRGVSVLRKRADQVLDEFSNAERLAMRTAAMDDIRALEKRLAAGRELLSAGHDPHEAGWDATANLLWAARHGLLSVKALVDHLPGRVHRWPDELRELLTETSGGRPPGRRRLALAAARMLYPREIDLHPFRVLLLLAMTDCTPEELHRLHLDDVEFSADGVRVVQRKARARRIRADFHPAGTVGGESVPTAVFDGAGQWDVPGLMRRLVEVNALTREAFGAPFLFTAVEVDQKGSLRAGLASFDTDGRRFSDWLHARSLQVSVPYDVRRLRKTAKTAKAAVLGGTLSDLASDDHHVRVFAGHYAHGTTAHVLAARAVNAAQQKVFDRLGAGPVLVAEQAEPLLGEPQVAEALGVSERVGRELRDGELDMGLTNCREPENSPFTGPGRPCHVAPAMCLVCPNAVVFTSQLPRLLLFADHVERLRERLDPPMWQRHWAAKARVLAELFEECAHLLPAAREQIAAGTVDLDLPLGMRTEYDR